VLLVAPLAEEGVDLVDEDDRGLELGGFFFFFFFFPEKGNEERGAKRV
jgi:hypothetical protein